MAQALLRPRTSNRNLHSAGKNLEPVNKPTITNSTMKKLLMTVALVAGLLSMAPPSLRAEDAPPAKAAPNVEQRLADLEAYVNNGARGADAADAKISSNVS